jgi:hypothetical protein
VVIYEYGEAVSGTVCKLALIALPTAALVVGVEALTSDPRASMARFRASNPGRGNRRSLDLPNFRAHGDPQPLAA